MIVLKVSKYQFLLPWCMNNMTTKFKVTMQVIDMGIEKSTSEDQLGNLQFLQGSRVTEPCLLVFFLLLRLQPRMNVYFNVLLTHIRLCKVGILARSSLGVKWNFLGCRTRLGVIGWIVSYLLLHLFSIVRPKWKELS